VGEVIEDLEGDNIGSRPGEVLLILKDRAIEDLDFVSLPKVFVVLSH
jgi:hypothetical protein